VVAPGVAEVEVAARRDLDAGFLERAARGFLVVDDETEMRCASGGCVLPWASATNWSPMSTKAMRPARPRSSKSKMRP
jgi:hypothetical protein